MDVVTCIRYAVVVDFLPPFLPPSQSFLCPFLNCDASVSVVVEDVCVRRNVKVTTPVGYAQYNLCQIDILWLSVNMYDEVRMLVFSYSQLVPSRFFHRTPPQLAYATNISYSLRKIKFFGEKSIFLRKIPRFLPLFVLLL